MRSSPRSLAGAAIVAALLLTSCAATGAVDETAGAETVEVVTPTGATISVPVEPTAALGFYTTDVDLLLTLGFQLADTQPIRDTYTAFPWFFPQEKLQGIETFPNFPDYNLEAVAAAQPDFVLNGLGYEEDLDGRLQGIAPTYTYNAFDGGDWRDVAEKAAVDLGREAQWRAWRDAYDARVADIRERLDAAGIDPVVADLAAEDGQVTTQCRFVPCLVFADLGLRNTPLANADASGLPAAEGTTLSPEQLGQLEGIDIAFSAQPQGEPMRVDNDALNGNALWTNLSFVQNGQVYGYDLDMMFGSPSGMDAFLTVVEQTLLGDA